MRGTTNAFIIAGAIAACAIHTNVHADQLADIKARGVMTCGILANFEPFGFQDPTTREFTGYDADYCYAIGKALGVKTELKTISLEARIPELTQKRVDILSAALGYTADRAKQINFSDAYFVSRTMVVVLSDKAFKSTGDLAGKRISVVRGGTSSIFIAKSIPTAQVVAFDDYPAAFLALTQGKVEGFGTSEVALLRFKAKLEPQVAMTLLEPPVGVEQWGLGMRKDEDGFKKAVNDALQGTERSGDAQKIFDKWLGSSSSFKMRRDFKIAPIPE